MYKIFRKRLGHFAGFGQNILFFYSFSLVHTKLIYMLYYYIYIYYFLFSETYWYFPYLCRFFYIFLAHLTDCIIGQLHTFVISAMYSSRHVFAVVSNSFLFTSISLSYFDWFLHLSLFSPHIWSQLVYFTSDAPNGVVPCLVRLTCWV